MQLFSTPTQFLVLGLVLVAGWLFGLASHPGGRKWRQRYTAERDAQANNRRTAEQQHTADKARIAELERDNARLSRTAPTIAATNAARAEPADRKRGWFDFDTQARPR